MPKNPLYKRPPIGSLKTLARILECPEEKLLEIAETADRHYRIVEEKIKSSGGTRTIVDALPVLKNLQDLINKRILSQVDYPRYLQGGIYDPESTRSYIADARIHVGCKVLISQDVKDFFPSVKYDLVLKIWMILFKFPPDVSHFLTKLTTRNGELPQGAITSPALANLVFFDTEGEVVVKLERMGLVYSRYVDDISVSSKRKLTKAEQTRAFAVLISMIRRKGLTPHRTAPKQTIYGANRPMQVHGLNVNSKRPTVPYEEKNRLRAAVQQLEGADQAERATPAYRNIFMKLRGQLLRLGHFHKQRGKKLKKRLDPYLPVPSEMEVLRYRAAVYGLETKVKFSRDKKRLRHDLDSLSSRIGSIGHARPKEAERLLLRLRNLRRTFEL
jgi:hypothetical protein